MIENGEYDKLIKTGCEFKNDHLLDMIRNQFSKQNECYKVFNPVIIYYWYNLSVENADALCKIIVPQLLNRWGMDYFSLWQSNFLF